MGRTFSYKNLTGGLNVENDIGTINQTTKATESPDMCNVEYYGLGGIQTMAGNIQFGDTITGTTIVGGWDYIKGNTHHMIITASDGSVRRYNNVTDTFDLIYTFPSATSRCSYVNMNNGVVISNGIDDLVFYEYGRNILLSGTVSVTDGSDTINGTSTQFTTELSIGDYITIEDVDGKYKVTDIDNDNKIKVTPAIDTERTIHYYGFFSGADIVYTLSATPSVGDNVYDTSFQVVSTVDYYLHLDDDPEGTGTIWFNIGGTDYAYRRQQISGQYSRDTEVTVNPASLSGKQVHISDISECNAKLTNEDDPSIEEDIRGLALQYYQGRLFIGDNNGALFYSELGSYNKFDIKYGGGVIRNIYNDTSRITALGLYSSYMMIHKMHGSYILDGKSSEPENWEINPYSNITCRSQQSFTVFNRLYFVYSDDNMGIFPLTMQTIFGDKYVGDVVSERINNLFIELRSWETDKIFVVRLPEKRHVCFYCPFTSGNGSNIAVIYDLHTKTWLRREVPQPVSIAFEYDNEVYIGTSEGKVYREFYGQSFDGEPIVAYWKSPWFDFGNTGYYKSFKEFALFLVEEKTCNFKLRVRKDISDSFVERTISSEIYDTDALVWDDDPENPNNLTYWDENTWVKTGITVRRFPTEKQFFYNYQIEFTTEDVPIDNGVQGFAIYGFDIRNIQAEETPL